MSSAARQLQPILVPEAAIICEAFSCAETRTGSRMRDGALFRHVSRNLRLPLRGQGGEVGRGAGGAAQRRSPYRRARGTGRMLSGVLNAYARSNVWDEDLFHRLSQAVRGLSPRDVATQDIATIVNAFARATTRDKSRFRDGALFLHMSRIAQAKDPAEFRARDVANIVNALARVGVWDEALFRKMSTVVRSMSARELPLRDAARIVCAFTLAFTRRGSRLRDGSLFRHVSDVSVSVLTGSDLDDVSAADISALAQAYTRAGIWDERLLRTVSAAARRLDKRSIEPRAIASLVSAFSQVETREGSRLRDGALFIHMSSIVKGLDSRALAKEPQVVANIVNAFAKAGVWDEELFRFLSRTARQTSATSMQPSDCGAVVGSFAKAQSRQGARLKDGALFRRMSLIVQQSQPSRFTPRAVANIASGFAHADIHDSRLLQRMARLACGLEPAGWLDGFGEHALRAFKTQELASLSWALAKSANSLSGLSASSLPLGLQHGGGGGVGRGEGGGGGDAYEFYFRHLAEHLQRRGLSAFKAQEVSTLLWSVAVGLSEQYVVEVVNASASRLSWPPSTVRRVSCD